MSVPQPHLEFLWRGGLSILAMCHAPALPFANGVVVVMGLCGAECAPAPVPIDSLSLMLPEYSVADPQTEMVMEKFRPECIALFSGVNIKASRPSRIWNLSVPL